MSAPDLAVTAVGRRFTTRTDPFALYTALTADGRRDTALFETGEGMSLLLNRAAVRVECRGAQVTLAALSANGETLLASVAKRLADYLVSSGRDRLEIIYPQYFGYDPDQRLVTPAPLHVLRALTGSRAGENPFAAIAIGIVAFDYAPFVEGLPSRQPDPFEFPDFIFWIPESLILFEPGCTPQILCTAFGEPDSDEGRRNFHDAVDRLGLLVARCEHAGYPTAVSTPISSIDSADVDLDDQQYGAVVRRLRGDIEAGTVYQIVPSRTFRSPCSDPLRAFAMLRDRETSPYRFFVDAGEWTLFGASPESSVRVTHRGGEREVEVRPIAGTRPRGATPDEDNCLEAELRLDEKEVAEHMMLVDLARNDVARISATGSRRVDRLLDIKRSARVMHLESSVTGTLRDDLDCLDALAACLNVGTLSGAPKLKATELLQLVETGRRGPYGGAIGWINPAGEMDTSVIIRSALVKEGVAHVRAGAGVVYDSDPQSECDETRRKASMILSVLASAEAAA